MTHSSHPNNAHATCPTGTMANQHLILHGEKSTTSLYFESNPLGVAAPYAEQSASIQPKVEAFLSANYDVWPTQMDKSTRAANTKRIFFHETNNVYQAQGVADRLATFIFGISLFFGTHEILNIMRRKHHF